MAFISKSWDGAASRFKDTDAYCAACLVDSNETGKPKIQAACKLPVQEPTGEYNTNALLAAQGALLGARGGVDLPMPDKAMAARKLAHLMTQAKMEPNSGLMKLAGS